MNKQEAYHVLGIPENASTTDIQSKYNELYNDYQIRLTNAPTPNLKKLYQKNLDELNEALAAFGLTGATTASPSQDLPSSGPVFNAQSQTRRQSETTTQYKPPVQTAHGGSSAGDKKKGGSNPIVIGGFVGVIGIAAAVFFGILNFETQKKLVDYDATKAQNDSLQIFKKNYSNAKFVIQNDGNSNIVIRAVIVEYTNAKGDVERYYDQTYNVDVAPGSSAKLTRTKGSNQVWDGSVVAYSVVLMYKDDTKIRAGLWSRDATKSDGVLHLNLDSAEE